MFIVNWLLMGIVILLLIGLTAKVDELRRMLAKLINASAAKPSESASSKPAQPKGEISGANQP